MHIAPSEKKLLLKKKKKELQKIARGALIDLYLKHLEIVKFLAA